MADTLLFAAGHPVGRSLVEAEQVERCVQLLGAVGSRLLLPVDVVALSPDGSIGSGAPGEGTTAVVGTDIPAGWEGVDIGPQTRRVFAAALAEARSVFWNGPLGAFEDPRFAAGTQAVAAAVAATPAFSVVGGGDTVAALDEFGLADKVSFVSTGGGASLELLEFGDLPGLRALRGAPNAPKR